MMRLENRKEFWNKIEDIVERVIELKSIAQNDMELDDTDVRSWLAECSSIQDDLHDIGAIIGDIQYEERAVKRIIY